MLTLFYIWAASALINIGFCSGACVAAGRRPDLVELGMILIPGANTAIAMGLVGWTIFDWLATLKAKLFG